MGEARGSWPSLLAVALGGVLLAASWSFGATQPHRRAELFLALAVLAVLAVLTLPLPALRRWPGLLLLACGTLLLLRTALASGPATAGWMHAAIGWMGLFVGLSLASQGPRRARLLVVLLILVGAVEALYGLRQSLGGIDRIGEYERHLGRIASGTLINRNHFAGLLNLVLSLALGALLAGVARRRRREPSSESYARTWVLVLGCSLSALAVLLSQSRGGVVTLVLLLGLLAVLARRGRRRAGGAVAVVAATVLALGLVVGLDAVLERFGYVDTAGRTAVYRDSLRLIADHPLAGVGPGTYRFRFRPYQSFDPSVRFDHAHNDYLEIAAEWGIPAAVFFWGFVGWRFLAAARAAACRDPRRRGLALGAAAAIFSILVHSLIDFNLQIPANLTLFAVVLGLAWSLEEPARDGGGPSSGAPAGKQLLLRAVVALALCGAVWRVAAHHEALRLAATNDFADLEKAFERDPREPEHAARLGLAYRDVLAVRDLAKARAHLERAVELNPHDWRYRLELARAYEISDLGDEAEASFRAAVARNPQSGRYRFRLAGFYVRRGELDKALPAVRRAVELDRSLLAPGLALLWKLRAPREAIVGLWPAERGERRLFLRFLTSRPAPEAPAAEALAGELWPQLLADAEPPTLTEGRFYLELLARRGRFAELRRQWTALAGSNGFEDSAFAARKDDVWNGGFENLLAGGLLGWHAAAGSDAFTVARTEDLPAAGRFALRIDFPGNENLDFQGLRQRALVTPGASYEFSFMARSREITTEQGLFFQVLDVSQRTLLETEAILGTTPWSRYSATFTAPAGSSEVALLLRRRPSRRIDNRLAGSLWLDSVQLTGSTSHEP